MGVRIAGSGMFLPPFITSNFDLENYYPRGPYPEHGNSINWSADWIDKKLGIKERHFAFDFTANKMREGFYDLDMGEKAARAALINAKLSIEDIDAIIYISSTPEYFMPDPACMLHLRLAAKEDIPALGLTSVGCGGFIYGMINASGLIESGKAENVLIVGAICVSSYMKQYSDPHLTEEHILKFKIRDRLNASMFGDGAGAMILQRNLGCSKDGLVDYYWGANGLDNPVIFEGGGSRTPATVESVLAGLHFFNMDGQTVKNVGPVLFEKTIQKILKKTKMEISDIDFFVFHQVNYRILAIILEKMGIPREKAALHVDRYGNLDTATLAVGYYEAVLAGKINSGANILFAAIGAGWQYGSAIFRF